jgi:AcrR family transcriptional regulator
MIELTGTKRKIIEVAIEMFSRKGYSAVSVRELTKAVGVKESSLYNHFKSKEEILELIYQLFEEFRVQSLPNPSIIPMIIKNTTIETFLIEGMEIFKKSVEDPLHEKMWRILNIEQFRDHRAREIILNQVYGGTIELLSNAFEAFMNEGKIKRGNPRTLAIQYQYPIFTMMTEYLLLKYDEKDTQDVEKRMREHVQLFLVNLKLETL